MSAYLNNKKLLVLGGNALSIDIVKQANKMGVHTIVTDWNNVNDSPAKLYASEYWNISLLDYDTLISKIKESHIDGIITGFTDSYLLPYQYLCEKCNLPCYATKQQFELTLDKSLFKATCNKYNVPTVPEYSINGFDKNTISESNKVILKPVDNSGSRGICICDTPESFDNKLKCDIISCRRSGSKVEFKFKFTSVGFGDISQFTLLGSYGDYTIIYDNLGNQYEKQAMSLGNQSDNGYGSVRVPLLEYVGCNGSISIENVPANAETLTIKLCVSGYDPATGNLFTYEHISIRNLPIY